MTASADSEQAAVAGAPRPEARQRQSASWAGRAGEAWRWAPLVCAVVYVVVLVANLRSLVAAIYRNADIAAAPEIGQLISRAPGFAETVLGNAPWYSALWFEQLTGGLPGHRTLWELAPWILTLVGVGLLAWAASRVAGRWAGTIIAATCTCAGATLLPMQFAWSVHAVAYFHICLLGAFIVALPLGPGRRGPWVQVVLAVLVALVTGVGIASDKLVIVGGLVPFVIAGLVLWTLVAPDAGRRVLAAVLGVAAGSILVAVLATSAAHSQNVMPAPFPITFAGLGQIPGHAADLVGSLAVLANGNFGGRGLSLTGVLTVLSAGAVAIAIYAVLRGGRALVAQLASDGWGQGGSQTPEAAARTAFLAYWAATAILVGAAFVLTAIPRGLTTSRYVIPVGYALVVIVAVTTAQVPKVWRTALLVAGSSAIILAAAVSLAQRQIQSAAYAPSQGVAQQLASFAAREHLTIGYAGYWDASPLTWELDGQLPVYPLIQCGTSLCPFPYHKINTWYVPHPLPRSFFVVDSRLLRLGAYGAISSPPAAWGRPTQVAHVGQLTVYVYPFNLAVKLLPS